MTDKKYLNIERWKADGLVVCDLTDQRSLKLIHQKEANQLTREKIQKLCAKSISSCETYRKCLNTVLVESLYEK